MNEAQAVTAAKRMFSAHGRSVGDDVVIEYAAALTEADCQPCMSEVAEQVRKEGSKVPPVSGLWALYRDRRNSPGHADHVGVDEVQVDVGKLEADWRLRGVRLIEAAGASPSDAKMAAARMWASGCVTVDQAGAEWGIVGADGAGIWQATQPKDFTPAELEARWDFARAVATKDPVTMTDEEWLATLDLLVVSA